MSNPVAGPSHKRQKLSEATAQPAASQGPDSGDEADSGFSSAVEDELPSDLSDEDDLGDQEDEEESEDDSETEDIREANARKQGLIKTSSAKHSFPFFPFLHGWLD